MASSVVRFDSLKEVNEYIAEHESRHSVKYVVRSLKDKSFHAPLDSDTLVQRRKGFIGGVATTVVGSKEMVCRHGMDLNANKKKHYKAQLIKEQMSEDPTTKKKRRTVQHTIKYNCPAKLRIQRCVIYPDFKIPDEKVVPKRLKLRVLKTLRDKPRNELLEKEVYILTISDVDVHTNHPTEKKTEKPQGIDQGMKEFIQDMVTQGVVLLADMKPLIHTYRVVTFNGKSLPDKSDRRFWPTDRTVTKLINAAFKATSGSSSNQENCVTFPEAETDAAAAHIEDSVGYTDVADDTSYTEAPAATSIPSELPKRSKGTKSIATECRELLRILASKTYMITDVHVLNRLYENLKCQLDILNNSVSSDEEIGRTQRGQKRVPSNKLVGHKAKQSKLHASKQYNFPNTDIWQ